MASEPDERSKASLFRPQALEHRARQRGPGDLIRIAPRWTTFAFYVLIALFAALVLAGMTFEIGRYVRGTTASDDSGRVVVLLPAALVPEVPPGRPVQIGDQTAEVVSADETVLYPPEVKERYGVDVAAPSIVVVTSGDATRRVGIARVLIEKEPVIVALVPGLKALFGEEDG